MAGTSPLAQEVLDQTEQVKTPKAKKTGQSGKLERPEGYSRKAKSLSLLCENFIGRFGVPGTVISLDNSAKALGVERRRIYDIINVLESIRVVSKVQKNQYAWHGMEQLSSSLAELQKEAEAELAAAGAGAGADDAALALEERKEKSMTRLSLRFVQMFMLSKAKALGLDEAARALLGGSDDAGHFKTKVRRLYDIANILSALHLIEKASFGDKGKPGFRWLGAEAVIAAAAAAEERAAVAAADAEAVAAAAAAAVAAAALTQRGFQAPLWPGPDPGILAQLQQIHGLPLVGAADPAQALSGLGLLTAAGADVGTGTAPRPEQLAVLAQGLAAAAAQPPALPQQPPHRPTGLAVPMPGDAAGAADDGPGGPDAKRQRVGTASPQLAGATTDEPGLVVATARASDGAVPGLSAEAARAGPAAAQTGFKEVPVGQASPRGDAAGPPASVAPDSTMLGSQHVSLAHPAPQPQQGGRQRVHPLQRFIELEGASEMMAESGAGAVGEGGAVEPAGATAAAGLDSNGAAAASHQRLPSGTIPVPMTAIDPVTAVAAGMWSWDPMAAWMNPQIYWQLLAHQQQQQQQHAAAAAAAAAAASPPGPAHEQAGTPGPSPATAGPALTVPTTDAGVAAPSQPQLAGGSGPIQQAVVSGEPTAVSPALADAQSAPGTNLVDLPQSADVPQPPSLDTAPAANDVALAAAAAAVAVAAAAPSTAAGGAGAVPASTLAALAASGLTYPGLGLGYETLAAAGAAEGGPHVALETQGMGDAATAVGQAPEAAIAAAAHGAGLPMQQYLQALAYYNMYCNNTGMYNPWIKPPGSAEEGIPSAGLLLDGMQMSVEGMTVPALTGATEAVDTMTGDPVPEETAAAMGATPTAPPILPTETETHK